MHKYAVATCLQFMPEVQQIDAVPNREQSAVQLPWHNREDSIRPAHSCSMIRRLNTATVVFV
jgi:hypothetical protein